MARIRSTKPEFWTSEQVMELSRDARLLFIGMWNFCDDAGIHPASPKRLKAEVFPADDLTSLDIRRLVDELVSIGLVEEYEVDGEAFWIVTGWHHQKIEKPTYTHPRPDGTLPANAPARRKTRISSSNSTSSRGDVDDKSPNDRRPLDDNSPTESSRVESSRKELGSNNDGGTPPANDENSLLVAVDVSKRLIAWERERGKFPKGLNASTQPVLDLASMSITAVELRAAYDDAVSERDKASDPTPVNAGFVRSFVEKHRRPPPKPKAPPLHTLNDTQLTQAGRECGAGEARVGESRDSYIDRIKRKQAENSRGAAA
ncbi:hypothetical protein [Pandoraea apista]|uniref:hypothetical protein n=1 Tax=Pandoraea apista TaxID=93218 RepID=UPI000659CE69|nr:hypothetical protein [Pandoraea apista]CFB63134.1 hypothetical protein LMG16407_03209 [Pandoraea apista]